MSKAYLTFWRNREEPQGYKVDVSFDHDAAKSIQYGSEEEAWSNCVLLNSYNIAITSPQSEQHYVRDFRTEKQPSGSFAIICELPWEPREQT
jgi:hypothetical protein